eukprot:CAMPEP_0201282628 /NCGR_PEP_ID=MMETSP1317-20130820/6190_1 /ASSEMBLY_ACC=CAM_ASM_000770 /TAXON_ID=187299 /ORGANISM="Undescribed Undescribed, Strain Undescribed" /LENGTH=367 /DNA_ID=CAMNT_0047595929 /DNA_START=64 /DNA_END=1164 /DNA_ORIENTATION=+
MKKILVLLTVLTFCVAGLFADGWAASGSFDYQMTIINSDLDDGAVSPYFLGDGGDAFNLNLSWSTTLNEEATTLKFALESGDDDVDDQGFDDVIGISVNHVASDYVEANLGVDFQFGAGGTGDNADNYIIKESKDDDGVWVKISPTDKLAFVFYPLTAPTGIGDEFESDDTQSGGGGDIGTNSPGIGIVLTPSDELSITANLGAEVLVEDTTTADYKEYNSLAYMISATYTGEGVSLTAELTGNSQNNDVEEDSTILNDSYAGTQMALDLRGSYTIDALTILGEFFQSTMNEAVKGSDESGTGMFAKASYDLSDMVDMPVDDVGTSVYVSYKSNGEYLYEDGDFTKKDMANTEIDLGVTFTKDNFSL